MTLLWCMDVFIQKTHGNRFWGCQGSLCVEVVCLWVLKREDIMSNSISFNRLLSLAHLTDCYHLNTNKYMRESTCQFIVPLIYTIEIDLTTRWQDSLIPRLLKKSYGQSNTKDFNGN